MASPYWIFAFKTRKRGHLCHITINIYKYDKLPCTNSDTGVFNKITSTVNPYQGESVSSLYCLALHLHSLFIRSQTACLLSLNRETRKKRPRIKGEQREGESGKNPECENSKPADTWN